MKKFIIFLFIAALSTLSLAQGNNPHVIISTSMGDMQVELFSDKAPETVKNFLRYVDRGFFNGTIFHRVIGNFMIQGGGMMPGMSQKQTMAPVINEASNMIPNMRGTLAMARTMDPHSATAQFFINVVDNHFLNHQNKSPQGWGYCVFGRIVSGMETADRIRNVPTKSWGPHQDVPVQDVVIRSIRRK